MYQKRLGDMASYVNGYAFKPEQRGKVGLPIIRIQDLTGNIYDLGFYDGDYPKKVEINDGDVLISWSASLGVYEWSRGKALLNQHIFKVVFDKLTVDKKFFMYAVQYKLEEMESKTHGATMKHITKKDFDNTVIPFPTIVEQERISNTLNKLHTIIDSKKFQLEKLDNLIKARFVEMFGDNFGEIVELGNVCDVRDGTHDSPKYHNEGYPLVTSKNICNGKIDFSTCNLIQKEDYDKINKRSKVEIGDILMPMIGTVGNPIIINTNNEFAIKNVALIKFKDNSVILNTFVKALLESDYFGRAVLSKTKGGTQKFISLGDIRKLELNLPPIELQNQFATFVAQVDKSKFTLSNELAMGNFYIRLIHDCIMHGCIDLRVPQ